MLTVGIAVLYVLTALTLDQILGMSSGILAMVPVVVTAWLFGLRGGVAAGLLFFPVTMLLVILTGGLALLARKRFSAQRHLHRPASDSRVHKVHQDGVAAVEQLMARFPGT